MAKIIINAESFTKTGTTARGMDVGTVEVSGVVQKAVRSDDGRIFLHGYVGRYRSGGKAWNASIYERAEGLVVFFGRDDRSGRFNKQDGISYEPQTFDLTANPDYWNAV